MNAQTTAVHCNVVMTRLNIEALMAMTNSDFDALIDASPTPIRIENAGVVRDIVNRSFDLEVHGDAADEFYVQILRTSCILVRNGTTRKTQLVSGPGRPIFHVQVSSEVLREPLAN